jgi:hypothetical protein
LKKTKPLKIIIIGLPKTGTSTLTVMLRMLGYTVFGPDIDFIKGDDKLLLQKFEQGEAFQDYPWCFEWQRFTTVNNIKFIILYRDREEWWKSFMQSYGNSGENYLSYPYMNIPKLEKEKNTFLKYYDEYYKKANQFMEANPNICFRTSIKTISWNAICSFLNEDIPINLIGNISKIPHVNKKNYKLKHSFQYRILKHIKEAIIKLLGVANYLKLTSFFHRNRV